ncbi:hypothetical protein Tco_0418251 [Tanacetum coccineum]
MLNKKEISLTLHDFRTIFHLPQATDNNHDSFVPPPSFLDMVPFYKNELGFTMELKTSSSFKTTGLLQPWQTLCKIFSKCLTTRVTGWDQPPLQIMQMIHKDKFGMTIPDWMILEEMKHIEHYRMYAEVFGIDVPLTQSQPTESTQGTYRKPSAPRRSTRLTPPAPVPIVNKAEEMILQDTLQHLASVEIEKTVDGPKNVIDDSSIPRTDDQNILGTRLEPRSDKESPEVEITNDEEVEITNVVILVNVNEEEEEITYEVYELKRREKRKIVEESRNTQFPTPIRSPRIHTDLVSSDTEKLQELTITDTTLTPSSRVTGTYGYLFKHLRAKFLSRKSFDTLADHLYEEMVESLPTMVDKHIKEQVEKQVPEQIQQAIDINIPSLVDAFVRSYMSGHILHVHPTQPQTSSIPEQQYQLTSAVRPRDQDDPHDDAHPERENSAKRQNTSEYEAHVTRESFGQVNEKEQKEVSLTINEAELKKIADEMLRQRCTSGDVHQYHIDQMKTFLKSDIVWESKKEILASPHPRKTTPLV